MTLRQLGYVLAVAETGSFTKAAVRLHVSQPSLSQQIQSLENEIGGRLFDRPPKPVRLTPAGQAFLPQARAAVSSAQRALEDAQRVIALVPETLGVATVRSLAVSMLPACMQRWHEVQPRAALRLYEYEHRRMAEQAVRHRVAEVGVGPAPDDWHGAYETLGWDELVVVLPLEDELLASDDPVPIEALAGRGWVLFDETHGLADQVERACAAAGFSPWPIVRTRQVEAAMKLAAGGLGPALVPAKNVPERLRDATRRLDPPVIWEIAAFAATPRFSRLSREFVDALAVCDWQRRRPDRATVLSFA
jgi:DNA-binding transcriptional LysR family regulator